MGAEHTYIISLVLIGMAGLAACWLPVLTKKLKFSYSIVFVAAGYLLYTTTDALPWPSPQFDTKLTTRLTEMIVIIALMGTGLRIDRAFSLRQWAVPLRLISITMLLCIAALTAMSFYWLGFSLASALLIGAALAPTDPVLAADVQVGPPNKGHEGDTRFSLTAEAGLNDGLAFPFVWMAIAFAMPGDNGSAWLWHWATYDLVYRAALGLGMGYLTGRALGYLYFTLPERHRITKVREGMMAVCGTLLVYGLTELMHGYGFIAVFITALTLRNLEMKHRYHSVLHKFTDQVERFLLAVLLMLFGGSLAVGILDALTWPMVALALLFVLIVRPLMGMVGLMGTSLPYSKRMAISFFGIRGVGSFFYLAFALHQAEFEKAEAIWSFATFVVLTSIVVHGVSAPRAMAYLRRREAAY